MLRTVSYPGTSFLVAGRSRILYEDFNKIVGSMQWSLPIKCVSVCKEGEHGGVEIA